MNQAENRSTLNWVAMARVDCSVKTEGFMFWADRVDSANGSELSVFFWLDCPAYLGRINSIQTQLQELGSDWQSRLYPFKK